MRVLPHYAMRHRSVAPPVNSVAPAASGTVTIGGTLTTTNGTWSGSPTYAYQWRRAGVNIGGATASTYTPIAADIGPAIDCLVTATNAGGAVSADSNDLIFDLAVRLGAKLKLWLRGDAGVTLVSSAVSNLVDQSGNGRDFAQGTAGSRPVVTTINGRAAIDFDGTDDRLETTGTVAQILSANSHRVLVAFELDAIAGTAAFYDANEGILTSQPTTFTGLYFRNNGGVYTAGGYIFDGAVKTATASVALGVPQIADWAYDGVTNSLQINAGTVGSVASGNISTTTEAMRLGQGRVGGPFLNGRVGEIIACDTTLTSGEAADSRAWLTYRWGAAT